MKCRQAKAEIALWVGHELEQSSLPPLKEHVRQCEECRCYAQELKSCVHTLHSAQSAEEAGEFQSVWPRLSKTLARHERSLEGRVRFNGWVPAVALSACVLAMVSIVNHTREFESAHRSHTSTPTDLSFNRWPVSFSDNDLTTYVKEERPFPRFAEGPEVRDPKPTNAKPQRLRFDVFPEY